MSRFIQAEGYDPLGDLVGIPAGRLAQRVRPDGVIEFRALVPPRDIDGEYDPASFTIKYVGMDSDGIHTIQATLRGRDHHSFALPLRSIFGWLSPRSLTPC